MEDYLKNMIQMGYIHSNGAPIKCIQCDSENLVDKIIEKSEHGIMEFAVNCKDCNQENGRWSYGNWLI